jgi:hypothetical protein
MSALYWLYRVVLPVLLTVIVGGAAGLFARCLLPPGFARVVVTTLMCEIVFLPVSWFFVLDKEERTFVREKLTLGYNRWFHK